MLCQTKVSSTPTMTRSLLAPPSPWSTFTLEGNAALQTEASEYKVGNFFPLNFTESLSPGPQAKN